MPARYPPIAPRAPNAPRREPLRLEQTINPDVLPAPSPYLVQLDALIADKRRFLEAHHPIKDALNIALQQPAGVLLQRFALTLARYRDAASAPLPSDDPGERQAGTASEIDDRPAIVAYAETLAAKAILGDTSAMGLLGDRIEGKPGLRKADLDAETLAQRERVRDTISTLVEEMVERRRTGGAAVIIDADTLTEEIT